jgi:hypothetical protein
VAGRQRDERQGTAADRGRRQLAVPCADGQALAFGAARPQQQRRHLPALQAERFGLGARAGAALFGFDLDAQQVAVGLQRLLLSVDLGLDFACAGRRKRDVGDRELVEEQAVARELVAQLRGDRLADLVAARHQLLRGETCRHRLEGPGPRQGTASRSVSRLGSIGSVFIGRLPEPWRQDPCLQPRCAAHLQARAPGRLPGAGSGLGGVRHDRRAGVLQQPM